MIPLKATALERKRVIGFFTSDAEIRASRLPLCTMRIDTLASAPLVSDEVGEFVFQGAPELFRLTILNLCCLLSSHWFQDP